MAYTWDNASSVMRLYVNGVIGCEIDYSTKMCTNGDVEESCNQYGNPVWDKWSNFFHLGEIPNWGWAYMGEMDEFRLYTRLLGTSEIQASMHLPPDVSDPELMVHYAFDECAGFVARDSTGKWDGKHGDVAFDGPTLGTVPMYVDSGAPLYGNADTSGARMTLQPPGLPASAYESITWSAFETGGAVVGTGITMKVTNLSASNAELVVGGTALQVGSSWPVEESAAPRVVDTQQAFELVSFYVGYQEARLGQVELVYDILDSSDNTEKVSGAKMKVALNTNRPPLLGNAGQAARFDGIDDYMGNFEFVLRHRTWTNDSSIYGTFEPTATTPGGAVKGGQAGAGHSKPVTVEFWALQTEWNLMSKPKVKGDSLGGMTVFSIGNSDAPVNGDMNCALEQPLTHCGGRFQSHLPWTFDHPFAYFDYGWLDRGTVGRSYFNLQPYVNNWVHIAYTADPDANSQKMYANGQLMGESGSDGPTRDLHSISLGAFPGLLSTHMGDIDEFRVYERAKTQAEIQADMHGRADASDPALLGYWHFDDCGNDGPIKQNCEDISPYKRPLTSANCGQLFSSKLTPGWGSQPGVNAHDMGPRTQLLNCKHFKTPQESDKASWPRGVASEAPLAANRATLRPESQSAEEANEFTAVIDALDPDYFDELELEIVALEAPGVTIHDADGNQLTAGSRTSMARQLGPAGPARNPMYRQASVQVRLPAERGFAVGSLTLRVWDSYDRSSAAVVYQIAGFVCGPGFEFNVLGLGESTCLPCNPGTFSPGAGGPCQLCPAGKFAPEAGHVTCDDVPPGTMTPDKGAATYALCAAGTHSPRPGATSCKLCDLGTYQSARGEAECVVCGGSLTTRYNGSTSSDMCTCMEGSYLSTDGFCVACPAGMTCAWGAAEANFASGAGATPMLDAGYYTQPDSPLAVYLCAKEDVCPGGAPGSCFNGRSGLLCESCPSGEALTENGCSDCSGADMTLLIVLVPILLGVLFCVYCFANSQVTANATLTLAASVLAGMFVTVAQVLASFRELNVAWPGRVQGWFNAATIVLFDTDAVSAECLLGSDPATKYVLRVVVPYAIGAAVLLLFALSVVLGPACGRSRWNLDMTMNTAGTVFQAIFTAITAIVAVPFQCYSHPNGQRSVVRYPDILCGEEDHTPLVALALVLLATFVLPFMTICIWGVAKAHVKTDATGKTSHFRRFRFIIYRFRPDVWWWSAVFTIRQMFLAFAPMVSPDDPHAQVMFVATVLSFYLCFANFWWPWKSHELNAMDTVSMLLLLMLIVALGSFMPTSKWSDVHSIYMLFLLIIMVVSFGLMGLYALAGVYRKGLVNEFGAPVAIWDLEAMAKEWKELCSKCAPQSEQYIVSVLDSMNDYDRRAVQKAMGAVQSAREYLLPPSGHTSSKRLVGLKRSPAPEEFPHDVTVVSDQTFRSFTL